MNTIGVFMMILCLIICGLVYRYIFYNKNKIEYFSETKNFTDQVFKSIDGRIETFYSSNPCLIKYKDGFIMNIRYVNYLYTKETGGFNFKYMDAKSATINLCIIMDKYLNIRTSHWFDKIHDTSSSIIGIEDIRLYYNPNNELKFIGYIKNKFNRICIVSGTYDLNSSMLIPEIEYNSPENNPVEKNWVKLSNSLFIYKWFPLVIGNLIDNNFISSVVINTPDNFSNIRGSTSGVEFNNQIWFIVHKVDYINGLRDYYHMFLVMNNTSFEIIKYSRWFKFNNNRVEYTLGFEIHDNKFIIPYSNWDNETYLNVYTVDEINQFFL